MPSLRLIATIAVFFIAAIGTAQQRRESKVYTNEDIAKPSAPPSDAGSTAAEPTPADNVVEPSQISPLPASNMASTSELQKALEFQQVLRQGSEDFQKKIADETDDAKKRRWTSMQECIHKLIEENQQTIEDLSIEKGQGSSSVGTPHES